MPPQLMGYGYEYGYSVEFPKVPGFPLPQVSTAAQPSGSNLARTNTGHTTGSYYFEMNVLAAQNVSSIGAGVDNGSESLNGAGGQVGGVIWVGNGNVYYNAQGIAVTIGTFSVGDILGVAVNVTNSLIWFRDNAGNWNNNASANPVGNNFGISIPAATNGTTWVVIQLTNPVDSIQANFAGPFIHTAPSGYGVW